MSEQASSPPLSRRLGRIALLSIAVATVVASAAYLIWKVGGIGNARCGQAIGPGQQGAIVAACLVAFAAGHWAQRFRHQDRDPSNARAINDASADGDWDDVHPGRFRLVRRVGLYLRTGSPTQSTAWKTGSLLTYGVLIVFYACGFLAVAYETYALWPGTNVPPITSLVRCARDADVAWTMVVAGMVSFLIGHWLWPPRQAADGAGT